MYICIYIYDLQNKAMLSLVDEDNPLIVITSPSSLPALALVGCLAHSTNTMDMFSHPMPHLKICYDFCLKKQGASLGCSDICP